MRCRARRCSCIAATAAGASARPGRICAQCHDRGGSGRALLARRPRGRCPRRPTAARVRRSPAVRFAASRSGATTAGRGATPCASCASALSTTPGSIPARYPHLHRTKQPWVVLPTGVRAVPEYYDRRRRWPKASLARREALLRQGTTHRAGESVDGAPLTSGARDATLRLCNVRPRFGCRHCCSA